MSTVERIALFIDGANLYASAKALGFDIDYKRLLREFQAKGRLIRAFYYTALVDDQEYSSIRPLVDWLDYNGYSVVTKPTKEFVDFDRPPEGQGQHGHRTRGQRDGDGRAYRPDGSVLGRRRLPFAGRGDAAQGRPGGGRVDDLDPAADGGRRAAPPGRRVHRPRAADGRGSVGTPASGRCGPRTTVAPTSPLRTDRRGTGEGIRAPLGPPCHSTSVPPRDCAACARLAEFRDANRAAFPDWWNGRCRRSARRTRVS